MGKKKKKKSKNYRVRNASFIGGRPVIIKDIPEKMMESMSRPEIVYPPIFGKMYDSVNEYLQYNTNIDDNLCRSYMEINRKRFYKDETGEFSRCFQRCELFVSTYTDASLLNEASRIAYTLILSAYNGIYDIWDGIYIEQKPRKGFGYFRLTQDSNPLPGGYTKQVSNYIIDNVAAVVRMMKYDPSNRIPNFIVNEFDMYSMCSDIVGKLHPYSLTSSVCRPIGYSLNRFWDNLHGTAFGNIKNPKILKWVKDLDIRTCMIGDIETIAMNNTKTTNIYYFSDGMDLPFSGDFRLYEWIHGLHMTKFISPGFGKMIHVITNPEVLTNTARYGLTAADFDNEVDSR